MSDPSGSLHSPRKRDRRLGGITRISQTDACRMPYLSPEHRWPSVTAYPKSHLIAKAPGHYLASLVLIATLLSRQRPARALGLSRLASGHVIYGLTTARGVPTATTTVGR